MLIINFTKIQIKDWAWEKIPVNTPRRSHILGETLNLKVT
jgi:hypothetical protein